MNLNKITNNSLWLIKDGNQFETIENILLFMKEKELSEIQASLIKLSQIYKLCGANWQGINALFVGKSHLSCCKKTTYCPNYTQSPASLEECINLKPAFYNVADYLIKRITPSKLAIYKNNKLVYTYYKRKLRIERSHNKCLMSI